MTTDWTTEIKAPARTEGQVIAVDLQGHGRTADIDRPIDERLMADDIAALIDYLGLDKPDLVGYSLGGGVAVHTAVKYPDKVRKLVIACSTAVSATAAGWGRAAPRVVTPWRSCPASPTTTFPAHHSSQR